MKFLFLFTMFLFCFKSGADSSHIHGGQNDPLRKLFREARVMAADRVRTLKICEFSSVDDVAKAELILSLQDQLAKDIEKTRHVWLSDHQGSCSFTQSNKPQFPLFLSFSECRSMSGNYEEAIELLIHESLHHTGVIEEGEVNLLTNMIISADTLLACPTEDYNEFLPEFCEGEYMQKKDALKFFDPGSNQTSSIGGVEAVSRYRRCNSLTGCADWVKKDVVADWYNSSKKIVDSTMKTIDFEKDFSFKIKSSNPPVFTVNIGQPNFDCSLDFRSSTIKPNFYCSSLLKRRLDLTVFNFFLRDPKTKINLMFNASNGLNKHESRFKKSCFWMKNKTKGHRADNGDFLESETVIFSHF